MIVLEVVSAAVATVLSVVMLLPQVVRLFRTKRTGGLSVAWLSVGVALNAWWLAYCVANHYWLLLPLQSGLVLQQAVALGYLVHLAPVPARRVVLPMGAMAMAGGVVAVTGGWIALGVALGAAYAVQLTPAVVAIYRAADPDGVSPTTWWLTGVEAAAWGGFGVAVVDVGVLVYASSGPLAAVLLLLRLGRVRWSADGAATAG